MLTGFEPTLFSSPAKNGRPPRVPSHRLRNLAWLRYLLDTLDDARHWSGAKIPGGASTVGAKAPPSPPRPAAWTTRPADAALLKERFTVFGASIPKDTRARAPSLLDEIYGPMFGGAEGGGGRYFADRILRGLTSPDAVRLQWLDDLVPGSRMAFESLPAGVDPWFYDALDFTNPWFAKLFLWRAMDPYLEDPGWDDLVVSGGDRLGQPAFASEVLAHRFADFTVSTGEVNGFESLIEHAAAVSAYPSLASSPVEELTACIDHIGAEALVSAGRVFADLSQAVGRLSVERQWAALSNALAARRVSVMLGIADEVSVRWLKAVRRGLTPSLREIEEKHYVRAARQRLPIDDLVERLF